MPTVRCLRKGKDNNCMSSIRAYEIRAPFHYVTIKLQGSCWDEREEIGANLYKLYQYIDSNVSHNSRYPLGNAYRVIQQKTRQLCGGRRVRIYKKEIQSLIIYKHRLLQRDDVIRVPYRIDYIFRAIVMIVDDLKKEHPLTPELQSFVGQLNRKCFYNIQAQAFKSWKSGEDLTAKQIDLDNDIFSMDCSLSKNFITEEL